MARNLSVDDLLKELDDLPNTSKSTYNARPSAVAQPAKPTMTAPAAARIMSQPPASSSVRSAAPHQAATTSHSEARGADAGHHRHTHSASASRKTALDELLDDMDDLPSSSSFQPQPPGARSSPGNAAKLPGRLPSVSAPKCMGLFIGGSRMQRGRNGSCVGSVVCCDSLRCTKCDFKVITFHDKEWDAGVDYLFFRNSYPTHSMLAPRLLGAPACSAYCCQCSWRSVTRELLVDFGGDLRWVCAGHSLE